MKATMMVIACAVVLALGQLAMPNQALAGDCGTVCSACTLGFEGTSHSTTGAYNMTCYSMIPFCVACGGTRASDGEDAEEILSVLKSGSDAEVRSIVRRNRGRFLISPSRNLVVLRGTECDPKAFAAVAYLDEGRVSLLQKMQLPVLAK